MSSKGSVLIVTIWIVMVLVLIVVEISRQSRLEMQLTSYSIEAAELNKKCEGLVWRAWAEMQAKIETRTPPYVLAVDLAEVKTSLEHIDSTNITNIQLVDEDRKLNVNATDQILLAKFETLAGFMIPNLVAWKNTHNYWIKFSSLAELGLVKNDFANFETEVVTCYIIDGKRNINTAFYLKPGDPKDTDRGKEAIKGVVLFLLGEIQSGAQPLKKKIKEEYDDPVQKCVAQLNGEFRRWLDETTCDDPTTRDPITNLFSGNYDYHPGTIRKSRFLPEENISLADYDKLATNLTENILTVFKATSNKTVSNLDNFKTAIGNSYITNYARDGIHGSVGSTVTGGDTYSEVNAYDIGLKPLTHQLVDGYFKTTSETFKLVADVSTAKLKRKLTVVFDVKSSEDKPKIRFWHEEKI